MLRVLISFTLCTGCMIFGYLTDAYLFSRDDILSMILYTLSGIASVAAVFFASRNLSGSRVAIAFYSCLAYFLYASITLICACAEFAMTMTCGLFALSVVWVLVTAVVEVIMKICKFIFSHRRTKKWVIPYIDN